MTVGQFCGNLWKGFKYDKMFWTELKVLGMHNIKILADADMLGIILMLFITFYTTLKTKAKK